MQGQEYDNRRWRLKRDLKIIFIGLICIAVLGAGFLLGVSAANGNLAALGISVFMILSPIAIMEFADSWIG